MEDELIREQQDDRHTQNRDDPAIKFFSLCGV
jgi:hypothetical protein